MDADEFVINVIAKKNNGTIECSVPDDVFNQAERILLKNEQGYSARFSQQKPLAVICGLVQKITIQM